MALGYRPLASAPLASRRPAAGANQTVTVPAAAIAVSGPAPTIRQPHTVVIPAAAIAVSGPAPSVRQPHTVVVPAAAIAVSGPAPTILRGVANYIRVPAASIAVTAYAPNILVGGVSVAATPPAVGGLPHGRGHGKGRKHKRRSYIEIDGEYFEVRTQAEAKKLLDEAKRRLLEKAKERANSVVIAQKKPVNRSVPVEEIEPFPTFPTIVLRDSDESTKFAQKIQAQIEATTAAIEKDSEQHRLLYQAIIQHQRSIDREDAIITMLLAMQSDEDASLAVVLASMGKMLVELMDAKH